jgi:hypothetical protein
VSDEDVILRPFPQIASGGKSLAARWKEYRRAMIDCAGIALFVFGNKRDSTGIVPSNGTREEFDLCVEAGVRPLPIGATGFMAETLWKEVWADFATYFPRASADFKKQFKKTWRRIKAAS